MAIRGFAWVGAPLLVCSCGRTVDNDGALRETSPDRVGEGAPTPARENSALPSSDDAVGAAPHLGASGASPSAGAPTNAGAPTVSECAATCDRLRTCCGTDCAGEACETECARTFGEGSNETCSSLGQRALECLQEAPCPDPISPCMTELSEYTNSTCGLTSTEPDMATGAGPRAPVPAPGATDADPTAPASSPNDAPPMRSVDGPSFAVTVGPLLNEKCTASCHEPGGVLGGPGGFDPEVQMSLTSQDAYVTLTTGRSQQVPNLWLVGTSLEDSYLWHKLNGSYESVGGKGAQMPVVGEFTAADLELVSAWITAGASP